MDKIFIRERINIVNYNNENQGTIYTSSDIDIEGGAINVVLESDVSGWHQLTFDMPAFIIKDGKHIQNPLLKNLFPLTKLQYTRLTKDGNKEEELILYFIIQPQDGTRDDGGIVLYSFTCIDYPRHVLSKAKNGITIGEDTLDEKRSMTPNNEIMNVDGKVIYVKAPVQYRTDFNTIDDLARWGDAKPGAFAYIPSTGKAYRLTGVDVTAKHINDKGEEVYTNWHELQPNQSYTMDGDSPIPEPVWSPEWEGYPLEPDVNTYDYGSIGINDIDPTIVQFYWDTLWTNPDKTIGRYDGLLYQEGSRLLYDVYETLDYEFPESFLGTYYKSENLDEVVSSYILGTTAYVIETGTVWRYNGSNWEDTLQNKREAFKTKVIKKGTWSKLDPLKPYLAPNYAEKYLDYILEGTGWKVGQVDKIMVDNGTVEFDDMGVVHPKQVELTTYLYFDNSNAYNAITELCNAFKCYPRFDHVNKIVDLKAVPGEDNNLVYQWRDNLSNTRITQDGEKAVSKLWVYGGEDLIGQVTIADCNRMNPNYYLADYTSLDDLNTRVPNPLPNQYAKISTKYKWTDLVSQTLKDGERLPIVNTFLSGELPVTSWGTGYIPEVEDLSQLPATGSLGQTVFVTNQNSYWSWFPEGNNWYDTFQETEPEDTEMELTFEQRYDWDGATWVDKGQFYHWYETLSPFADNYILDFSYFLERNLMTKEQEDDIKYNYILPISRLNRKRWPLYKEYDNLNQALLDWNATYDECKIARDAIDKSLRTTYAIYETDNDGLITVKELNVSKYPAGANYGPNNASSEGWVKAAIVYSESNAPIALNYADIPNRIPNPKIGDYVKVEDEVAVYYYSETYSFNDTICEYLGWTEEQVKQLGPEQRDDQLLTSPDGMLEARNRGDGLFEKLRREELYPNNENDTPRTALAPWYNPPTNINEMPTGTVSDPKETSLMHSYYDAQDRYVTEQINMNYALDQIGYIETQLTLLLDKIEVLENQITNLEHSLREKYGDYIVEGVFTDDTIVWIYNLWYAGLEALNLYHRPLVTYELGVVDVSGLPEYRTVTKEIYHDIVYRMNHAELVLPNPGDYCYVTDNTLGLVRERANVTTIRRNLSSPSQHEISIKTVDTNTEDLIGKVVTAANTIYSKEQIYNRSAVVKADGTIAQNSIAGSLDDNSGKMTIMSNNGTVILGDNGIITTDRDNALLRMQYTGKGIFASTNGGVTWDNIVNAGKISIKSLSAGTIDANTISVTNIGKDSSIIIDGKGITAINYSGASSTGGSISSKVDPHTSFFLDSKTGNAFFRGMIEAGAGLIGGWSITTSGLTSGSGTTFTGMSSTSSDYRFVAGGNSYSAAKFAVKPDGTMKATGATISGNLTATDGKIGGWTISGNALTNNKTTIGADGSINVNNQFVVDANGNMRASSGTFSGNITASNISGTTITGGSINCQNVNISGAINATSGTFRGAVYASSGTFKGTVSASTISGSTITGGSVIDLGDSSHYFKMNVNGVNHPEVSALNITGTGAGGGAIDFGSGYGVYINGNAGEVSRASTDDSVTISGSRYPESLVNVCVDFVLSVNCIFV